MFLTLNAPTVRCGLVDRVAISAIMVSSIMKVSAFMVDVSQDIWIIVSEDVSGLVLPPSVLSVNYYSMESVLATVEVGTSLMA